MLPEFLSVVEVCPRDGWQNLEEFIPTRTKIDFIKKMIDNGIKTLEITSFVNPKAIPQFVDAADVVSEILPYAKERKVEIMTLALNQKGVERAHEAGIEFVNFVLSASEEHNMRNSRRTIAESLANFREMATEARGLKMELAIACSFGSPFGDDVPMERVLQIIEAAQSIGVRRIGLADSAGISSPKNTKTRLRKVKEHMDVSDIALHLHDTWGMGLANAYVALEEGIGILDASLGGLGGCPFIPGAKGNIATEDLACMAEKMGVATGLNFEKTAQLAQGMGEALQRPLASSVSQIVCRKQ
jgi:hydroxymethylglutaryl-CoA lyase